MKLILTLSLALVSMFSHGAGDAVVSHTIVSGGHPLTLWEKSPHHPAATIVLLHGRTWSSLPNFDLQVEGESLSFMEGLNDRGFSTYALDARGYGATPRDASGWLTPDQAAADVIEVLEWLVKRNHHPHLFGWSYGSMVAQLVAQRRPDLVESLILFGYPFDPKRHVADVNFAYPAAPPSKSNTAEAAASDFITPGSISKRAIEGYVQAALLADPVRVDFRNLHEWSALAPESVNVPVLLLQGQYDPLTSGKQHSALFLSLAHPNKWWVVLPGGDHAALLETPRIKMLDTIKAFTGQP